MTTHRASVIGLLIVLWSACALGQSIGVRQPGSVEYGDTDTVETIAKWTEVWRLETEDWKKYQALMQGRYGLWYRGLDPVWVLGIAAETEQERMRYARLAADIEERRVEDELAFQRAYDAAWKEKNPQGGVLDPLRVAVRKGLTPDSASNPLQSLMPERRVVFIELTCRNCRDALRRQINLSEPAGIDIYVAGAENDDAIRQWAAAMNIDLELVKERVVTLNHDAGYYEQLTGIPLQDMDVIRGVQARSMSPAQRRQP